MAIFDSYVSLPEGTRCYFGIFWYAIVPNFEKLVGWFHFSKSKPTIAWVLKKKHVYPFAVRWNVQFYPCLVKIQF